MPGIFFFYSMARNIENIFYSLAPKRYFLLHTISVSKRFLIRFSYTIRVEPARGTFRHTMSIILMPTTISRNWQIRADTTEGYAQERPYKRHFVPKYLGNLCRIRFELSPTKKNLSPLAVAGTHTSMWRVSVALITSPRTFCCVCTLHWPGYTIMLVCLASEHFDIVKMTWKLQQE